MLGPTELTYSGLTWCFQLAWILATGDKVLRYNFILCLQVSTMSAPQ